uniref:(northern house mosquito) hypothetical protein n=1 Tax=Culex pipiens TaxID=7175 RepID=A0A8D8GT14_CULPI
MIQVITVKYASIFIITNQPTIKLCVCYWFEHADLIDPGETIPRWNSPFFFSFWGFLLASVVKMTTPRNILEGGRRRGKELIVCGGEAQLCVILSYCLPFSRLHKKS